MKVWGFFMLCWIQNCKCQYFFVYCGMNNKYQKYINYIVNDIELPYIKSLEPYGLKQDEMDLVLSKVFNQPVKFVVNRVFDIDNNEIYIEDSNGYWVKYEFNEDGNLTYVKDSKGYWIKSEYNEHGNIIYYEDSNGNIHSYIDKQYIE